MNSIDFLKKIKIIISKQIIVNLQKYLETNLEKSIGTLG